MYMQGITRHTLDAVAASVTRPERCLDRADDIQNASTLVSLLDPIAYRFAIFGPVSLPDMGHIS